MITLKSDRLQIQLAEPGEAPNCRFRFDRAGYITEVILDNTFRFCASEPQNLVHPNTGGRGLCSEYRFDVSGEASVGEYFPKFGVGLLKKERDEPYLFHRSFKDVAPFPVTVTQTGDSAVFRTGAVPCLGYAMEAEKTVSVSGNLLTMTGRVTNAGEKAFVIEEYCHNFLSIDGMAVGPDYHLILPGLAPLGHGRLKDRMGRLSHFLGEGNGLTFGEYTPVATDFAADMAGISEKLPFVWRLSHQGTGVYVEGNDYFVPSQIAVWGVDHMLCPEIFQRISLAPGETLEWKRTWKFEKEQPEEGAFPLSQEAPEGMKTVSLKDTFGHPVDFFPDVVYAGRDGCELHLQILTPFSQESSKEQLWPLIVYVQGSAWHKQRLSGHLPHLLRMAQRGFVTAVVEYRPSDAAPFPAQVEDAKAAIRFLKQNAKAYHINPDQVILWGDSSGGHTALMAGFTGDREPDGPSGDADRASASVQCIVDWYGPTEIDKMNFYPSRMDHAGPDSPEGYLIGRKNVLENPELAAKTEPAGYLSPELPTPPLLIMHGNGDRTVPFNQSCRLFERMKELGKEVEFVKIDGADHGTGGFNCDGALDLVESFIRKHLQ